MSATPPNTGPARSQRPPTWATTLPIILATFLTNIVIDLSTDWSMAVRWAVALVVGVLVGAVVLAWWQRSRGTRA